MLKILKANLNLYLSYFVILIQFTGIKAQTITFSKDSVINTGYLPFDITCADFNGDNLPDMAFSNINQSISDPVQVHLNDGFGKLFSEADSHYVNINDPKAITVGDLNNDQIQDLAYLTSADSTALFLFGNGDGSFTRGTDLKIPTEPAKIVIADFNKDLNNDIAVASRYNTMHVYHGDGSGSFSEPLTLTGTGTVGDLEVADMNKDGYIDLLIGSGNLKSVVLYLNDGTGNAFTRDNAATFRTSGHIKTADFNNDGYKDIIAGSGSYDFDNIFILLGDETGEYTCIDTLSPVSYVDDVVVADFNHDFRDDVIIGDRHGIYLLTGSGDGHFGSVDTLDYEEFEYQTNTVLTVDMDMDGRTDIVVARDQQISVYYNTTIITSIEKDITNPVDFKLHQNYPNPFNPTTTIEYFVRAIHESPQRVNLSIYNLLGQKVATLVNKKQRAGTYTVQWDALNFSSGIYFCLLKINNKSLFRKMQLVK